MKKLFYNATVYTGNDFQEAFIVEDNRFIFVGKEKDALRLINENDEKINLNEQFVCAGFNDSHMHLLSLGRSLSVARLNEHTNSKKEMYEYLKDYVSTNNDEWIIGMGWNQNSFSDDKNMPNRKELDEICKDRPMYISRCCGHIVTVNSKALELSDIKRDTASLPGGEIDFENGLLSDSAIALVKNHIPLPSRQQLKDMIIAGAQYVNSLGITSVQSDDYTLFNNLPFETINNVFKELEEENRLTVRVYEQCRLRTIDKFMLFLESGLETGQGSDMYRIGPLKLLCDGSLGARTAALSEPYHDDLDNRGLLIHSDEELEEFVKLADKYNMQIAAHAIGDRALDQLLNAYSTIIDSNNTHRHGVVHCQVSRKDQLQRMIEMKLHIYAQSVFLDTDIRFVKKRLSDNLINTSYSWKTLVDGGPIVSNGSDSPVEIPDVLKGIQCATTRRTIDGKETYLPEQSFSVKEAIDSFTINGAIASFDENKKGMIKEGYLADFVVLDNSPFEVNKEHIHNISVLNTYLDGKCVFSYK